MKLCQLRFDIWKGMSIDPKIGLSIDPSCVVFPYNIQVLVIWSVLQGKH